MGCKVKRNKSGRLALRLFWPALPGGRSWESTDHFDTPQNRRLVEAQALLIDREIKAGTFDYLKWFPYGNKAAHFAGLKSRVKPVSVGQWYDIWIARQVVPLIRKSLLRSYEQHFGAYILPRWKDQPLSEISVADLNEFRVYLIQQRGHSIKTAKNIINGSLRAFFRDAQAEALVTRNLFKELPVRWWPRHESPPPDPFTWDERERIIEWFYHRDRHYHSFVAFSLWQYVRPSETTALRWGRVDFGVKKAEIFLSRNLQTEAPTKTASSRRVIDLYSGVSRILWTRRPLNAKEQDFVFINKPGRPINSDQFRKHQWYRCLSSLKVRPRDFYTGSKDTAISLALSSGENPKRVAEQAGISLVTMERRYGKWMDLGATTSATLKTDPMKPMLSQQVGLASPTGFEPPVSSSLNNLNIEESDKNPQPLQSSEQTKKVVESRDKGG